MPQLETFISDFCRILRQSDELLSVCWNVLQSEKTFSSDQNIYQSDTGHSAVAVIQTYILLYFSIALTLVLISTTNFLKNNSLKQKYKG